jgi:hypothetical protein
MAGRGRGERQRERGAQGAVAGCSVAGVASGARHDLIAAHAWPTGNGHWTRENPLRATVRVLVAGTGGARGPAGAMPLIIRVNKI